MLSPRYAVTATNYKLSSIWIDIKETADAQTTRLMYDPKRDTAGHEQVFS